MSSNPVTPANSPSPEHVGPEQVRSSPLWLKIGAGVLLVAVAAVLGEELARHLPALEKWVESHGFAGMAVFVLLVVVGTSVFIPDSIFALAAGALFGLWWGTAVMGVAGALAATMNFFVSRHLLEGLVQKRLAANPKLVAIQQAVQSEGFRLLFLLRLTPVNPVTVSYLLGVTRIRYRTFIAATAGLLPGLFMEVYFGYLAKHVAKASGEAGERSALHTVMMGIGLLACVALVIYSARVARRALATHTMATANPQ